MKLKLNIILYILILLPILQPDSYAISPFLSNLYSYGKLLSFGIVIILVILNKKISKFTIFFIAFQTMFLISSFINGGLSVVKLALLDFCCNTAIVLASDLFIKKDAKSFLKSACISYGIIILIMVFTMFKYYPQGMYTDILWDHNYYFLGHDNGTFYLAFPIIIMINIYSLISYGKIKSWAFIFTLLVFAAYFYTWSVVSFIMIGIILIYLLTSNLKIWTKVLKLKYIICFTILFFFGIIIFKIQNYFSFIIVDILHKDLTFSGRTKIWDLAIEYIAQKPLLGYGFENIMIRINKFGISHIHNMILQLLYQVGIIGFTFFITSIAQALKPVSNLKQNKLTNLILLSVIIFLISGIIDFYNSKYLFYLILVFCLNSKILNEMYCKTKKEVQ